MHALAPGGRQLLSARGRAGLMRARPVPPPSLARAPPQRDHRRRRSPLFPARAAGDSAAADADNPDADDAPLDPELEELLREAVDRIKRRRAGLPDEVEEDPRDAATPTLPPPTSSASSAEQQERDSALMSRLRGQMRVQGARDEVVRGAAEGAERLRQLGAELERELDEALRLEKFRAELEGGAELEKANAELDELEQQIEAMKEAARRGREEQEAWEEGAAAARSKGLFFGSLHEGPLTKKKREAFKAEVKRRKAEVEQRVRGIGGGEEGGGGGGAGGGGGGGTAAGGGTDLTTPNKFSSSCSPSSATLTLLAPVAAVGSDPSAVARAIARQRMLAREAELQAASAPRRAGALASAALLALLATTAPPQAEPWRLVVCASLAAWIAAWTVGAPAAVREASDRRLRDVFGDEAVDSSDE
jgi:hypothetical protein